MLGNYAVYRHVPCEINVYFSGTFVQLELTVLAENVIMRDMGSMGHIDGKVS